MFAGSSAKVTPANVEVSLERSRRYQREVEARAARKRPNSPRGFQNDERAYFEDPGSTLKDLRQLGRYLGIDRWSLRTFALISGAGQVAVLCILVTSSWVLPWVMPSAVAGVVLAILLCWWYVRECSETALLAYICLCVSLWAIALSDTVVVRNCQNDPRCQSLHQIWAPCVILLIEMIAALAAMHVIVFKTPYVPRPPPKVNESLWNTFLLILQPLAQGLEYVWHVGMQAFEAQVKMDPKRWVRLKWRNAKHKAAQVLLGPELVRTQSETLRNQM